MKHPRGLSLQTIRRNPFRKRWQYWGCYEWIDEPQNKRLPGDVELRYEDTWCEPEEDE